MTSLTCTINKGDYPIKISWTHNNLPVDSKKDVSVYRTNRRIATLSIDSVQAEHAGEYSCIAKNKAGFANYSAVLNVNGIFDLRYSITHRSSVDARFRLDVYQLVFQFCSTPFNLLQRE